MHDENKIKECTLLKKMLKVIISEMEVISLLIQVITVTKFGPGFQHSKNNLTAHIYVQYIF